MPSSPGTLTARSSKRWKVLIEVKMEDMLRLLKTKLPLHCCSPTLFRRRFRFLYSFFYEQSSLHLDSASSKSLQFSRWMIFPRCSGGVWDIDTLNAIRFIAEVTRWDQTGLDGVNDFQVAEPRASGVQGRLKICCDHLKLIYNTMPSLSTFIERDETSKHVIFEKSVIASAVTELVYRVETGQHGDNLDVEVDRYFPVVRAKLAHGLCSVSGNRGPNHDTVMLYHELIKLSNTKQSPTSDKLLQYFDQEWLLLAGVLQSVYRVDIGTVEKALRSLNLNEVDAVLLLSFLFLVQSCRMESVSSASASRGSQDSERLDSEFVVNWLYSLFEASDHNPPGAGAEREVDEGDFSNKSISAHHLPQPMEDVVLKQFFDLYNTKERSASSGVGKKITEELLNSIPGVESAKSSSSRQTILHTAVIESNIELVQVLLQRRRVDVSCLDQYGKAAAAYSTNLVISAIFEATSGNGPYEPMRVDGKKVGIVNTKAIVKPAYLPVYAKVEILSAPDDLLKSLEPNVTANCSFVGNIFRYGMFC